VVLCPPEESGSVPGVLDVVLFGSAGTPYAGGQFKVRLQIGPDYPAAPPKGFFLTKIFHPNVSKAGDICVNTLKKDWSEKLGLKHVLLTIRCLLIQPNPESALNEDAGKLLLEDYEEYAKQARLMTQIHATKKLISTVTPQDENVGKDPEEAKVMDVLCFVGYLYDVVCFCSRRTRRKRKWLRQHRRQQRRKRKL
jgi:ubiquitin-conjugating enzyme E2 S